MLQTSTAPVHIAQNIGSLLFQNSQNMYWIFLKDYFFMPLAKEMNAGRQVWHMLGKLLLFAVTFATAWKKQLVTF